MTRACTAFVAAGCIMGWAGCTPGVSSEEDPLTTILGASAAAPEDSAIAGAANAESQRLSDRLGALEYKLYELGPAAAGDAFVVIPENGATTGGFVAALFDENQSLLMRTRLIQGTSLEHVLRRPSGGLTLGIMPVHNGRGGDFTVRIEKGRGAAIPDPRPQNVWLNFAGARSVIINGRRAQTFNAFEAGRLSSDYAAENAAMMALIVELIRADYAPYNVAIFDSNSDSPPSGEFSTVHFGGEEVGLLGLADSVDSYNADPSQAAIVYLDSFAPYVNMGLTYQEMAVMIANVASHELGHLLGLYHTRDPLDIMDTTGTARDLSEDQNFSRAALEQSVFAVGLEDSVMILSDTVGIREGAEVVTPHAAKVVNQGLLQKVVQTDLLTMCGTCACLDEDPH